MTTKWKFSKIPPGWVDRFPDGDYTVGRGADPRGVTPRPSDEAASQTKPKAKATKRKSAKPIAAE